MKKNLRGVSLFSGAGGMDLGFINAGVDILWANDFEKDAVETYKKNIGDHIKLGNIKLISSNDIPDSDIIFGGPPCQGFSVAGKMDASDQRSSFVWEFFRIVRDKKPKLFLMENVKNLVTNERFFHLRDALLKSFRSCGYNVEYQVLNSKDYLVPQARERAIFIGIKSSLKINVKTLFPEPVRKEVSVRKVLSKLPRSYSEEDLNPCKAKIVPAKNPVLRKSPYAGMLFNGQGRPLDLDKPAITMTASMGGNKTPFIDENYLKGVSDKNWVEEYHSHLIQGGKPVKTAPKFLRRITVLESKILQSFPPEYDFYGSQCSKYRQIGNAVPPRLAQAICESILTEIK